MEGLFILVLVLFLFLGSGSSGGHINRNINCIYYKKNNICTLKKKWPKSCNVFCGDTCDKCIKHKKPNPPPPPPSKKYYREK